MRNLATITFLIGVLIFSLNRTSVQIKPDYRKIEFPLGIHRSHLEAILNTDVIGNFEDKVWFYFIQRFALNAVYDTNGFLISQNYIIMALPVREPVKKLNRFFNHLGLKKKPSRNMLVQKSIDKLALYLNQNKARCLIPLFENCKLIGIKTMGLLIYAQHPWFRHARFIHLSRAGVLGSTQ